MPLQDLNHRHYKYSEKYGKKILHTFNEPYYGMEEIDKCTTITISIPRSLKDELARYTDEMGIPISRYLRILIEKDLRLSYKVL